jgi:hypothetical protein
MSAMNRTAFSAGQTLLEIAAATGGTAFRNSNNILDGLERAPSPTGARTTRWLMSRAVPISVRARDGKWVVSAKRGYWASGTPK